MRLRLIHATIDTEAQLLQLTILMRLLLGRIEVNSRLTVTHEEACMWQISALDLETTDFYLHNLILVFSIFPNPHLTLGTASHFDTFNHLLMLLLKHVLRVLIMEVEPDRRLM